MSKLKQEQIKLEILRLRNNEGLTQKEIADVVGIHERSVRRFLNKESHKSWWNNIKEDNLPKGTIKTQHDDIEYLNKDKKKFVFTSAQNNTYVHRKFLSSLLKYCEHNDAQLVVGTFSYSKSGFQNLEKSDGDWFDPLIKEYIVDEAKLIADDLVWCGELNILPTVANPLSRYHNYTKYKSAVIPHAKLQLESVPTRKYDPCKMLYTTGCVTQQNYIQKSAGQIASFHHVFSAQVVEIDDDGDWFVRQLVADSDTGQFYDLDHLYTPDHVYSMSDCVRAINYGDLHSEQKDEEVYEVSFGKNGYSMLDVLKPKEQFCNDTLDFYSRNHHIMNDCHEKFKRFVQRKDSVTDNIREVVKTLYMMNRPYCKTVVVESNHDNALKKWLKTADYRQDPANAILFLALQLKYYMTIQNNERDFSLFEYATRHVFDANDVKWLDDVKFLRTDESYVICGNSDTGIECGQHGHNGNNGSRPSIATYQKLGTRHNIGHSHSAAIKDGVYVAGVSGKLDMGYNVGGSSWSHSHIVTYENGKRTIVTIKNGKWRA